MGKGWTGRRWTKQEDYALVMDWANLSSKIIGKRLDRSPRAVVERARKLGLGPQRRGTMTLSEFAKTTGYSRSRIKTAAVHLRVNLMRVPRGDPKLDSTKYRWHAIGAEAQDKIVEYLGSVQDGKRLYKAQQGKWGGPNHRGGRKPTACIDCGRNDVPHFCRGRCSRCDQRWRAGYPPLVPGTGVEPARA